VGKETRKREATRFNNGKNGRTGKGFAVCGGGGKGSGGGRPVFGLSACWGIFFFPRCLVGGKTWGGKKEGMRGTKCQKKSFGGPRFGEGGWGERGDYEGKLWVQ